MGPGQPLRGCTLLTELSGGEVPSEVTAVRSDGLSERCAAPRRLASYLVERVGRGREQRSPGFASDSSTPREYICAAGRRYPRLPHDSEASSPDPGGPVYAADQERLGQALARRRRAVWCRLGVIGVLSWAGGGGDGYGALASVCVRRSDGGGMAIYTWIFERPHRGGVKASRRFPKTSALRLEGPSRAPGWTTA